MGKVYYVDPGAGWTKTKAREHGCELIPADIFYHDEPVEDIDGVILDERYVKNFRPNAQKYYDYFSKHEKDEIVFLGCAGQSKSNEIHSLLAEYPFPNLKIIDTGGVLDAQRKVIERVLSGDDSVDDYRDTIKHYFIIKAPTITNLFPNAVNGKYNLYRHGGSWDDYKWIAAFTHKCLAIKKLRSLVNSPLTYRKDLNATMGLHFGNDYVGGIWTPENENKKEKK